jgi:hypothetical protein
MLSDGSRLCQRQVSVKNNPGVVLHGEILDCLDG